jgi:hypothetical protein
MFDQQLQSSPSPQLIPQIFTPSREPSEIPLDGTSGINLPATSRLGVTNTSRQVSDLSAAESHATYSKADAPSAYPSVATSRAASSNQILPRSKFIPLSVLE